MAQPDTNALTPTLSLKGEGARDTLTPTLSLKGEGVRMGHWLLITLLLLATALRFYHLDAQSFWNDEGNSARLSERSLSLIIEGTASDIHPPLYYLILRGWRELVGDTEFGLRSFSAFVGVGLVAVTIALGRAMWGRKAWGVWLAGLFVALNPALIYYSQETRMYALMAFLALLATLILWRWVRVSSFEFRVSSFAFYALTITAGLYTHYFFPTIILVHGVVMVVVVGRDFFNRQSKIVNRQLLYWLLALLAAGLLYLPWLPVFLRQARGRDTTTTPVLQFLTDSTQWLLLGGFVSPSLARWVVVVAIGLLLMAVVLAVSRWPLAVGKIRQPLLPRTTHQHSALSSPQHSPRLSHSPHPHAPRRPDEGAVLQIYAHGYTAPGPVAGLGGAGIVARQGDERCGGGRGRDPHPRHALRHPRDGPQPRLRPRRLPGHCSTYRRRQSP
ncbi:MAG: hypothetical protein IPL78_08920 [Chloroflexi bacterium]|nr:hypothetical protein [Chloroflexota bacterium]